MVASVTSAPAAGGPVIAARIAAKGAATPRTYDSFYSHLRPPRPGQSPAARDGGQPSPGDETKGDPVAQMFLSTGSDRESPAGLAPEEQSVLAERRLEPGEWLALFQPVVDAATAVVPPPGLQHPGVADVSALVDRWVRRVALGGDGRRGAAKLDIGGGRFAGAELVIVAEPGRVAVELSLPTAGDIGLAQRLQRRLQRRGYTADVVVR